MKKEYIYGIVSLLIGFALFGGSALSWSGGWVHEITHNLPGLMLGFMLFVASFFFFTTEMKQPIKTSSMRD